MTSKTKQAFGEFLKRRGKAFWATALGVLLSLPLSAGYVTYERGSGGGASSTHVNNLNEDAQSVGYPTDALRDAAIALGYGNNVTDADIFMAARGESSNDYPTPHVLTTANGDNISANQYEEDCDYYILVTSSVTGDSCADLTKTQFLSVKTLTEDAIEFGYDSNQQRLTATGLGYADSCNGSDLFHEARGQTTGRCNNNALNPPQASDCATYSANYNLVDVSNAAISTCGAMTNTQYASFQNWVSGQADADAQQYCYESDLERSQAIALGYDGTSCSDAKLYARALGRRLVNYPTESLLNISFASGTSSTLVQIAADQYEDDCDAFIADGSGVSGDGCADLQRAQFASIRSNHDASQNDGYGGRVARTAAVAGNFATDCDGANAYYVSIGATANPTLNPNCALQAPFTGLAGPACWDSILDVTYYQIANYEKADFACVLNNTSTTSPRFSDTSLASLTDGEFLYLKECFYDEGNNRTVQGLRDCATSATEWDQAVFPIREISTYPNWGGGDGTASCNLTLAQIEALGAFDDLNEGTYLSETKTLFDGDHCRKLDGSGEEVNCKEIVCEALKNPPTTLPILSNRDYMRQHMCGQVNRAYKQKAYHYKIKKHYFVEACQAPLVGTSDDFDILSWPMVDKYRVHYGFTLGRAPNQNQNYSGISYWYDAGPESWETERSLTMGRFEHSPVPAGFNKQMEISAAAGTKDLRIYSFGNVSRHRQTTWSFDVRFKSNLCISSGRYQDHNDHPSTGLWGWTQNFYRKPFPVSILPNEVDAARNPRQRGAIESSDSTMNVALVGTSAGTVSVGNMQAASSGQTPFERNHFKSTDIGAVKITSLPALGTLTYRASSVTANQILPSGDLSELKYEPAIGAPAIDNNYTSFTFRNYAPWSSVETALGLTAFACYEVPDFETESPPIPTWAWPDKFATENLGAHNTGGIGYWNQAKCSGQSNAATTPGGPDWTTPNDYQKVLRFINIPTPSDPANYSPSSAATTGLTCDE